MRFAEKLSVRMKSLGLNGQKLARASGVSDSEISRILNGKSANPGLDNGLKLARAVGASLDYLADDGLEADPYAERFDPAWLPPYASGVEAEIQELVRELGARQARRILETASALGFEVAVRRLLASTVPLIEVGDPPRAQAPASASAPAAPDRRATSA